MPITDYDIEELEELHERLALLMSTGRGKRMRIIIGGDFNTVFGIGRRG